MLKLTNPGLRRSNVVLDSITGCISNATEEFSGTPKMSFSKVISQPRVFFEKLKSAVTFKQLESHTNTHRGRHLNKQVDVINSDVKFINLESFSISHLPQEKLTIHSKSIKLEGIFGIFNFPHEVESILSEAMFSGFQIHFLSPKSTGDPAHANFTVYFEEPSIQALLNIQTKELNLMEGGNSSLGLKAEVSLPRM